MEISSTRVEKNNDKDNKELLEAVNKFIKNIENGVNTILSDNKYIYVETNQNGGGLIDNNFKMKYIKYKNKYLNLKQKNLTILIHKLKMKIHQLK